jgi:hypothetical protein
VLSLTWLAAAPASAQQRDAVTGTAFACDEPGCPTEDFGFALGDSVTLNVSSDPSGGGPAGTLLVGSAGPGPGSSGSTQADVTCLSVAGKRAIIGFTGLQSGFNQPGEWEAGFVRVIDGGPSSSRLDSWQVAVVAGEPVFLRDSPLPGPTDCSSFPTMFVPPPRFNDMGDLSVTDITLAPSRKEECKKGGWRKYGETFRNQGRCVAFVERGPKPADQR